MARNSSNQNMRKHIEAIAESKRNASEAAALKALRKMKATGETITFSSVAAKAGLSRSTLYNNDSIREAVEAAREKNKKERGDSVLKERVKKLEEEKGLLIAQLVEMELLKQENEQLKKQVEKLQRQRSANVLNFDR